LPNNPYEATSFWASEPFAQKTGSIPKSCKSRDGISRNASLTRRVAARPSRVSGLRRLDYYRGGWSHRESHPVLFVAIYSDYENVITSWRPREWRDRHSYGQVECCSLRNPRRAANLKGRGESERLLAGQAWDHKRVPVLVLNREFRCMSLVGLVPSDLDDAGDCEWLRKWSGMDPRTTEKKQETFADLRAICQDDFSSQRWRPSARRSVEALGS